MWYTLKLDPNQGFGCFRNPVSKHPNLFLVSDDDINESEDDNTGVSESEEGDTELNSGRPKRNIFYSEK